MAIQKQINFTKKVLASISILLTSGQVSFAQIHQPFLSKQHWLNLADEQFAHQNYNAARLSADLHLYSHASLYLDTDPMLASDKAKYIAAVSGLKINTKEAVSETKYIVQSSTNPAQKARASYALAQYYFSKSQWSEAISYYEQADIANLSNDEIVQAKFEMAYCYFNNKQFDKAKASFEAIKNYENSYQNAAHYYYGLLAYNTGDYKAAHQSFDKIENIEEYKSVVPYYIAELLYFEGAREKALQKAKKIIAQSPKNYYDKEANLLAAQCLFEDKEYTNAIPYFEYYYNNVDKIRKQDVYKMAYSYYATNQYSKAIEPFKQLSTVQDEMGQTAMYYLGDCYLKTEDKKSAKNAWSISADMPYNSEIISASLLLSGKLALQMGYSSEGSIQLNKLLTEYPNSGFGSEATNILSEQLLKSNNYSEAYKLLSKSASPSPALLQKCAYGFALQKMQQKDWADAERLLDESLRNSGNQNYEALAYFWKAEIDYRNNNFATAVKNGNQFLVKNTNETKAICPDATVQNALLTMGYASLKSENYSQARGYFAQAQNKSISNVYSPKLAADAALREADVAFLQKDYNKAGELYNKIITEKGNDADYAQFQKSTLLGLQGKSAEQAELLMNIVAQSKPESKYKYEAHYALGDLYLDANKYEDAITNFQKINESTAKHLRAKALMKIGFAYQEADNDARAIETYKKIIVEYPNTELKTAALDALKNLYVGNNKPEEYLSLLKQNNINNTDNASMDSLFYAAAEAQFANRKYTQSITAFDSYLKQYPQGIFKTKANFYKGESHYQQKELSAAIQSYNAVVTDAWSDYTEPAAKMAAQIAFATNDYEAAAKYYAALRNNAVGKDNLKIAYRGLMLSADNMNKRKLSSSYADTLLNIEELDENTKNEALLIKANDQKIAANYTEATNIYKQLAVSKNVDIAAEANYNLAEIIFLQNNVEAAEKATNTAIQQTTNNVFWNTKAYLLMADIFVAQKDYFNAKATLQSIVKNVKIESLKKEATAKLEQVKGLEKGKSKLKEG